MSFCNDAKNEYEEIKELEKAIDCIIFKNSIHARERRRG